MCAVLRWAPVLGAVLQGKRVLVGWWASPARPGAACERHYHSSRHRIPRRSWYNRGGPNAPQRRAEAACTEASQDVCQLS